MNNDWDEAYHRLHKEQAKEFSPFCRVCTSDEEVMVLIPAEQGELVKEVESWVQ